MVGNGNFAHLLFKLFKLIVATITGIRNGTRRGEIDGFINGIGSGCGYFNPAGLQGSIELCSDSGIVINGMNWHL